MADYYPLIARAIGGLPEKTGEARKAVYERARRALLAQLTAVDPPLAEPDVARERQSLETAIDRVEAEFAGSGTPAPRAPAMPPAPSPPVSPPAAPVTRPPLTAMPPANPAPAPYTPAPYTPAPSTPTPSTPTPSAAASAASAYAARVPERPVERSTEPVSGFHPTEAEAVAAGLVPTRGASGSSDWRSEATRLVREREAEEVASHAAQADEESPAEETVEPARSGGGKGRLFAVLVFVLLLIAGGVVGYTQRETIVALINGVGSSAPSQSAQSPAAPAATDAPKSTDRIAQAPDEATSAQPASPAAGGQPGAAVGTDQRAVLFEESAGGGDQGLQQYVGDVVWSTERASASDGQPADVGVRAEISIPARNISATLTFRRNQDPSIPASHIIEVQFKLPQGFDLGNISSVPGMRAKASEGAQGQPLVGLAVRVAPNYFLVGLSSLPADVQRNLGFVITRNWLDLPLVFENGRRAILVLEKGGAGDQAFREAFSAWGLPVAPPAQDQN